jgi:hypothetical protein
VEKKKRVKAIDDWFPTADDGKVEVSIHKDGSENWRVAVWGDDDFGMEKGGLGNSDAIILFRGIRDGVSKEALRKKGFINA